MAKEKPELVTDSTESVKASAKDIDAELAKLPVGTKERAAFTALVEHEKGALFGRCEFSEFRDAWLRRDEKLAPERRKREEAERKAGK